MNNFGKPIKYTSLKKEVVIMGKVLLFKKREILEEEEKRGVVSETMEDFDPLFPGEEVIGDRIVNFIGQR